MARKDANRLLASSQRAPAPEAVRGNLTVLTDPSMAKIGATAVSRRRTVILKESDRAKARFAEVAGGKTAECAAICCCCPCGLVSLIILALVRLPACLCRRALQKRILHRRSKKKAKLLGSSSGLSSESSFGSGSDTGSGSGSSGGGGFSSKVGSASEDEFAEFTGLRTSVLMVVGDSWPVKSPLAEVIDHENEVWSKFYNSGFWRSHSQKEGL